MAPRRPEGRGGPARRMTIEFIHGSVESAIITYQSRVSNMLWSTSASMDCAERGVPYHELEILLCVTLARYELGPLRIRLMRQAATDDKRAIGYLEWIEGVLTAANRLAGQTGRLFMVDDETGTPREVFTALSVVEGHFREDRPARGRRLRAQLGLPGERLRATKKDEQSRRSGARARERAEEKTAERAAIGYFSAEMTARFRAHGHGPCDDLIADLLSYVSIFVSETELPHYRAAYLTRIS